MSKDIFFSLMGVATLFAVSCSNPKASSSGTSADTVKVQKNEPISLGNGYEASTDTRVSGHDYHISIRCVADKRGEVVTDELGQKFYPNRVEVAIVKDGKELLKHSFVKSEFAEHLPEKTASRMVLQGMSFYEEKSDASYLSFTSLVGEPGLDGGSAFLVKVSTENGSFSIVPDLKVMEEEGMEEMY